MAGTALTCDLLVTIFLWEDSDQPTGAEFDFYSVFLPCVARQPDIRLTYFLQNGCETMQSYSVLVLTNRSM